MLDQVDVDLNDRPRQSLPLIGDMPDVQSAPELEEWRKVSMIWRDQPPDDHIHLFVKLPATGEQKRSLHRSIVLLCSIQPLDPFSIQH